MENDNKLIYIDEEGTEILCEILFTFDSEEFEKSYVLFYEVGTENEEEVEVLAASYIPLEDGSVGELHDVETEEEWAMIEETLEMYSDEDEDEENHHHHHEHECGCGHKHDEEDEDCECDDDHECDCDHKH